MNVNTEKGQGVSRRFVDPAEEPRTNERTKGEVRAFFKSVSLFEGPSEFPPQTTAV